MARIVNLGSTCYISSTLQLLFNVDRLREQILIAEPTTKLGQEFKCIFNQMKDRKKVNVRKFANLFGISDQQCINNHEDIQEFMFQLKAKFDSDPPVRAIFESTFNGVMQSTASTTQLEPFFGTMCIDLVLKF